MKTPYQLDLLVSEAPTLLSELSLFCDDCNLLAFASLFSDLSETAKTFKQKSNSFDFSEGNNINITTDGTGLKLTAEQRKLVRLVMTADNEKVIAITDMLENE